ncbi:MAG: phosphopantothenoylcysteine decarboxylase [Cyanobacteria bacterium P01_C01_bin.89]
MTSNTPIPRPTPSTLGDREVPLEGTHLRGKRVALLISGSIAAYRSPDIARALRRQGADVVAFASDEALRYVTRDVLGWSTTNPVITKLTPAAEHLSADRPFAAYVLAPATYNTLNKFRLGIADTVLTSSLASALGRSLDPHFPEAKRPKILVAPCMHGSLHTPILDETLAALQSWGVRIIPPRDAYGKHNLPDPVAIAVETCRAISNSPLRHRKILVTGGPTPVPIDNVRRLTNKFTGRLGMAIAEELYRRGADTHLIHGQGTTTPPSWLPHEIVPTYDVYRQAIHTRLAATPNHAGIFSAAVADYAPETVHPGKLPSGDVLNMALKPTEKVIAQVRRNHPQLAMVTFKYQEQVSHDQLMDIARDRLTQGYEAVIANRGEDQGPNGEQVAYLVTKAGASAGLIGKSGIAGAIADYLETSL